MRWSTSTVSETSLTVDGISDAPSTRTTASTFSDRRTLRLAQLTRVHG